MNVPRELIRCANVTLAITIPILVVGAILLRHASEGIFQMFCMAMFFANFPIYFALEKRASRRQHRPSVGRD